MPEFAERTDEEMFGGDGRLSHLIIVRAADADSDGPHVQAKVTYRGEPDQQYLDEIRAWAIDGYTETFGEAPTRVGVAVLPYVEELDEDD